MRSVSLSSLAVLAVAFAVVPLSVRADPVYLPLSQGSTWSYEGIGDLAETMTVTGTRELLGSTVSVIDFSESTHNEPLENYWTEGLEGDVLLWGYFRDEDRGWGLAYDPPILWLDAPVFVGKTWAGTTQVFSLPGEVPMAEPLIYEFTVTWHDVLSVPAGDFEAVAIGNADTLPPPVIRGQFSADGRSVPWRADPDRWYSDGVGLAQYNDEALYELVAYGISPVEPTSWARIKHLYR